MSYVLFGTCVTCAVTVRAPIREPKKRKVVSEAEKLNANTDAFKSTVDTTPRKVAKRSNA
jgi:hypothetical protein